MVILVPWVITIITFSVEIDVQDHYTEYVLLLIIINDSHDVMIKLDMDDCRNYHTRPV